MKKSIFLTSLFFVLLISSVSALQITQRVIDEVIVPDFEKPAQVELTIRDADEGFYNIYTLTDVYISPTNSIRLNEGTNKIVIEIHPTQHLKQRGHYTFAYSVKKIDGDNFPDKITLKVADFADLVEISSDTIDISSNKITFYVQNKENTEMQNIKARFSSVLFNEEREFDLNPRQKTEITINADDEKLRSTRAGVYIIKADVETKEGIKTIEGKLYLGEKKGLLSEDDSNGIIINTRTITRVNSGNVPEVVEVEIKKNIFSGLFTTFNIEPTSKERRWLTVTYIWNEKVEPAEMLTIRAKTNYLIPILLAFFAAILIIGLKRFKETKVEVTKSVHRVSAKGGEFALKVRISIKARKNVENVSLIDKIPGVVKVYEKFGLVKPDKIDSANRRLQWNVGNLNAGEERVFNYMVYSKVGIVGTFSLPEALVVFEENSEIKEVESNRALFTHEPPKKEE